MLLMCDSYVQRELGMIACKLVQRQRRGGNSSNSGNSSSTSDNQGPSLFVILPDAKVTEDRHSPKDFRLYFLCEYGMHEQGAASAVVEEEKKVHVGGDNDDNMQLKLHICESTAVENTSETTLGDIENENIARQQLPCLQGGYRLRNIDMFVLHHAISMLSLLCVLQENRSHYTKPSTTATDTEGDFEVASIYDIDSEASSRAIARQIRFSIRYLASYCYETLQSFQENPSLDDCHLDDFISTVPGLQWSDFLNDQEAMAVSGFTTFDDCIEHQREDPLVFGASVLHQVEVKDAINNNRYLWICQLHSDIIRDAPKIQQLSTFINEHGGEFVAIDKSCSVRFELREDAQEFYRLLIDSPYLRRLKLSLSWRGDNGNDVTEEDLWELCEAIHKSSLKELKLACGGDWSDTPKNPKEDDGKEESEGIISFKPLLGIICKSGLFSLTVEKFDGYIFPGLVSIQTQGDIASFSLQQFRESESIIVPENIPLKRMIFRYWKYYPDIEGLTSVVNICSDLVDFDSQTVYLEGLFQSIQNSPQSLGNITYFSINQSPFESADVTFWRLDGEQPAVRKVQRRSALQPSRYIQNPLGVENWTVTQWARLWEVPEAIHDVIHNNIGTLKGIDLACEIDHLADFWLFVIHELMQAEAAAASVELARGDSATLDMHNNYAVFLRMNDLEGHKLESLCSQRLHRTSLLIESYDSSFLPYLKPLSEVASTLCIESGFNDAIQFNALVDDVSLNGFWFHELSWFLTPQTRDDPSFMAALSALVHRPEVEKFTIRIDGGQGTDRGGSSSESIKTLLDVWNELTGISLGWMEYGQWMQEVAVQMEHPFHETISLPTGTGELTFTSEDTFTIGAAPISESEFEPELMTKRIGPVIYGLSVNTVL
ncbi:hypothetical protein BGZ76_001348 [Entomortierella beljakovae]|nr:hypothetical protein BGZ76_001348 [Entomortierella beljakovae]